jgi:signal transduction histidine kinase
MTARLDLGTGRDAAVPLERAPVELGEVVRQAATRFANLHPEHGLVTEVQPELVPIDADAAMLRRVFDNLLDNAAKYAPAGAGPIEIEVSSEGGDAPIVALVRDRGPGVAEEDLPSLFEPFFRADKSRERGTGGVGLGLALCRRVVVAHGGAIEARLCDGGGLEVRFTLPTG